MTVGRARFTMPEADHAGEFRAKLIAGNGEIVTASEGYTARETAAAWPADMLRWVIEASEDRVRAMIDEVLEVELHDVLSQPTIVLVANEVYDRLVRPT